MALEGGCGSCRCVSTSLSCLNTKFHSYNTLKGVHSERYAGMEIPRFNGAVRDRSEL